MAESRRISINVKKPGRPKRVDSLKVENKIGKNESTVKIWKTELKERGFVICKKGECRMGFLSIEGILTHFNTCPGTPAIWKTKTVACPICEGKYLSLDLETFPS